MGTTPLTTSAARATVVLTTGRVFGFVVAFVIPLVLARHLTQDEFGTYKYLFLLAGTLGFLQLGMAESLYYFLPKSPELAGGAVANAVVTLTGAGAAALAVFAAWPQALAGWIGNPGVAAYLPVLGVYLALTLITAPLEIVMVAGGRYAIAAVTYAVSDTTRAALLTIPAIVSHSVGPVLWGAVAFGAVRGALMLGYLGGAFRGRFVPDPTMWRAQWAYAIPFTAAVILEFVQGSLHQYVVAARVDAATFAIYSVGCMQVPLVDLITSSVANVMMVRMGDCLREGTSVLKLWHGAVVRLSFVLLPFVVALMITARELITTLYPASYLPSAPIFVVSTLLIALSALPVDAVLRVYAATRFLIVMNVIRLVVTIAAIGWAFSRFNLLGAIGITVAAQVVGKTAALVRIGQLLHLGPAHVLPWSSLAGTTLAALISAAPALWVQAHLSAPPIVVGAITTVAYAATYLAIMAVRLGVSPGALGRRLGWQGTEGR